MGLRHGFHLLENEGRSSVNEATSGLQGASSKSNQNFVGTSVLLCHQKVGHVHLAVPIVAFLRWHFCSITKALLAAPFSSCHFFQKVLKYLVLGVLRRFITIGPDLQAGRTTSTSPGLSAGHPTWAISHGEPFWSSNLQKAARGEGHLTLTGSEREY